MTRLTVPSAPLGGGATAAVPRPVDDGLGRAVAEFGERLAETGLRLEESRLNADLGRARVGIANGLAELRLETETLADPDRIDATWTERTAELRGQLLQGVDQRNQEAAGLAFDELAGRHGLAVGQRANELRRGRARAGLIELGQAHDATPGIADFDTRASLLGQYTAQLAAELAQGNVDPEEVPKLLAARREELAAAAAIRTLSEDPARLLADIDDGRFNDLAAETRERFRASAVAEDQRRAAARASADASAARARSDAIGDQLEELARIAASGRAMEGEAALLTNPEAIQHPGFAAAQAAINLRQTVPGFSLMTPADMDRMISVEAARPAANSADTALLDVMRKTRDAADQAWKADPLAHASRLGIATPAPLPEDLSDPAAWTQALRQRRSVSGWLADEGYTEAPALFTADEREHLSELAGVAAPPQDRAALAATLAAALGRDADAAFAAIAPEDAAFRLFGQMIAGGGPRGTALAAFRGQQALAGKVVKLPSEDARRLALAETLGDAMQFLPAQLGEVMSAADALYGEYGAGIDPKEDPDAASAAYARAIQGALGRSAVSARSDAGGVQEINDRPTLLPLDLSADQVEDALDALDELGDADPELLPEAGTREKMRALSAGVLARASKSGGAPGYASGAPLSWNDLSALRFTADAQGTHVVQIETRGELRDLVDLETGGPFRIDLRQLVRETERFRRTVRDARERPERSRR